MARLSTWHDKTQHDKTAQDRTRQVTKRSHHKTQHSTVQHNTTCITQRDLTQYHFYITGHGLSRHSTTHHSTMQHGSPPYNITQRRPVKHDARYQSIVRCGMSRSAATQRSRTEQDQSKHDITSTTMQNHKTLQSGKPPHYTPTWRGKAQKKAFPQPRMGLQDYTYKY